MRQAVVEVQCDRCKRKEYKPAGDEDLKTPTALSLNFGNDEEVVFQDLCTPCDKTVRNYVQSIIKEPKGKSPERVAKKNPPDGDSSEPTDDGVNVVS